jgi:hypothetical protein
MAAYQDIYLDKGNDFTEQLTLSDDYGTSYNLTSFSVSAQARISYISSNVALQFTSTITDAANGVVTLSANSAITSNVVPNNSGKLVYDVFLTDTINNKRTRVLEGQILVSPNVTQ